MYRTIITCLLIACAISGCAAQSIDNRLYLYQQSTVILQSDSVARLYAACTDIPPLLWVQSEKYYTTFMRRDAINIDKLKEASTSISCIQHKPALDQGDTTACRCPLYVTFSHIDTNIVPNHYFWEAFIRRATASELKADIDFCSQTSPFAINAFFIKSKDDDCIYCFVMDEDSPHYIQ